MKMGGLMKKLAYLMILGLLFLLSPLPLVKTPENARGADLSDNGSNSCNHPPVADAGKDQTAYPKDTIILDGSNSTDPSDDIVFYSWTQLEGPKVVLSDPRAPKPVFLVPNVNDNGTSLVFELTVMDSCGLQSSDNTTVTVLLMPEEKFPVFGGSAMGDIVLATVSPDEFSGFKFLISEEVTEQGVENGRIYLSIEVVGVSGTEGLMWFRPSNDRVPTYLKLANANGEFLADAEENAYFEGRLTHHPRDLGPFLVRGIENLRGVVLIFKTWYLKKAENFSAENLKRIQTVMVSIQSELNHSVQIPTIGGYEAKGSVVDDIVSYNLDPDFQNAFKLLLSQQAVEQYGRLYLSIEVIGIPQWEGLMWFRPAENEVPPYVVLSKADGEFLESAKEDYFFKGLLSAADNKNIGPFQVNDIESLRGLIVIFKSWYLAENSPDIGNLDRIQTVIVAVPSFQFAVEEE